MSSALISVDRSGTDASPQEDDRLSALYALDVLDSEPEERFDRVTRLAQQLFGVPMALVTLVDRERQWFKSRQGIVASETPRRDAFCNATIASPDTTVIPDAQVDERFRASKLVTGSPHIRFYAGHPIEAPGGERVGALCILDSHPRELSELERVALKDLALYVQKELTDSEDHRRAAEMQRNLLPLRAPVVPDYELAAACVPAGAVGGDFYDWYPTAEGLRFTVGDVMGKGIAAALMMATVRAVVRSAVVLEDVAATVTHTAATLDPDLDATRTLVTLVHAELRTSDGSVRYVDAGHGLTVLVRSDGTAERLPSANLPLGAPGQEHWEAGEAQLEPGDTLAVFSDGVLDLFDGSLAAVEDLSGLVCAARGAEDVVARIAERASATRLVDDVTLVVVRRR